MYPLLSLHHLPTSFKAMLHCKSGLLAEPEFSSCYFRGVYDGPRKVDEACLEYVVILDGWDFLRLDVEANEILARCLSLEGRGTSAYVAVHMSLDADGSDSLKTGTSTTG